MIVVYKSTYNQSTIGSSIGETDLAMSNISDRPEQIKFPHISVGFPCFSEKVMKLLSLLDELKLSVFGLQRKIEKKENVKRAFM